MSGEQPPEDERPDAGAKDGELTLGQTLYTEAGDVVGTIRGVGPGGVFVTTREGVESLSVEHVRAGHEFGEAELMWRCTECGEMGRIKDGLPDRCTGCGAVKEALMYWTED
jgi:hypothetical protein